jgi:hypothetical protein
MQQGQLISSLWEALPHLTRTDPVQSKSQNSQVYQGKAVIRPAMIKNSIIIIIFVIVVSYECNFNIPKFI